VSGKQQKLVDGSPRWQPAAQFSTDGKWVYFTADGQVYRHPTKTPGPSEPITALTAFAANGQVSPNGKWLAFRRNDEIWVPPLSSQPIKEDKAFRFSPLGGHDFNFTPDSLVYSTGADVWLHPLKDGGQKQVPIQLKFSTEPPSPVLLRNVRVLDFKAGGFTEGTSLLIEDGRIKWIGGDRNGVKSKYLTFGLARHPQTSDRFSKSQFRRCRASQTERHCQRQGRRPCMHIERSTSN
jgi:hypothetical protein